jgi:predicted MFS family arabinose efflux permease
VIGVAIGGPLIEAVGWRWIFVAQVPMILIALAVAAVVLPETERGTNRRFDWAGVATLTTGVTSLLFALNRAPEWGWTSPAVIIAFAASPLCLVAFLAVERTVTNPLIPPAYLRRRNFAFPIASQVFANFAYMGGFILAPQLLAGVFGHGESRIGLMVMTRPLAFSLIAPFAGYLAVKVGERVTAVSGSAIVAVSMLVFVMAARTPSQTAALAALVLAGIGLGVSTPPIAATVANSVAEADLGIASAAQQVMNQVGMVSGIQLMKTVQSTRVGASGLAGSFADAYWLGAAVCVLAVILAAFLRPNLRQ